jgi:phytoene synthase
MTSSDLLPKNEDVTLACAFIDDAAKRTDVLALYAFLDTLRDIPERVSEPLMGEIRLRWWYEAIEEIEQGRPVRYHPLTEVLKRLVETYRLDARIFHTLIEGQMPLLDKGALTTETAMKVADAGEGSVARLATQIVEPGNQSSLEAPARLYGMARLKARRGLSDAGETELSHLRRDAGAAMKGLSTRLMPLALPAALATSLWQGRPHGPLGKRLKLLSSFLSGLI